jgi:hypothetical protein
MQPPPEQDAYLDDDPYYNSYQQYQDYGAREDFDEMSPPEAPPPLADADPLSLPAAAGPGVDTSSMQAFLDSFRDMSKEAAAGMSIAAGIVHFKEELHQTKWRRSYMVICPPQPRTVDEGVPTQALLLYDLQARKERKKAGKGGGPTEVKPLRYSSFERVDKGDVSLPLPRGVSTAFVVTLSSDVGTPSADEFAFYVDKKKPEPGDSTEAQWIEALGAVQGEAAVLLEGQLELQGQKLQSHEWTPYRFELKGPVLSYYEGTKKLGAIHFEDPNTNVEVKEEEPDKFEVLSPKILYVLRCVGSEQSTPEEECNQWVTAMQDVKARIAMHSNGEQADGPVVANPQISSQQPAALSGDFNHDLAGTMENPSALVRDPIVVTVDKQAIGAEFDRWPYCQGEEQYLHVTNVKSHGSFASQQVQQGMVVAAINGQDCAGIDEATQKQALARRPVTVHVGFVVDDAEPLPDMPEPATPRSVSFQPAVAAQSAVQSNGETPLQQAKARYKNQWQLMSKEERNQAVTQEVAAAEAASSSQADISWRDLPDETQGTAPDADRRPDERDRPTTIAGYLRSRSIDVSETLRTARPSQSTSELLLHDLDGMVPSDFGVEDEHRMRGVLLGKTGGPPGLPAYSASTLRQAERIGRPISVSLHDPKYSGEDLQVAEHTRAGTHKLSTLTGSGAPERSSHIDDDFDHEYSKAVDGFWGGTLDPVARLRAAAQLTDLTTMKDALHAEDRRQRLPSAAPQEYADPVELAHAKAELEAAIEQLQARYREERSRRRQGQSSDSLIAKPDSMQSSQTTLQADMSPPPKERRRVAQTDPAAVDDDYDPTAADIASRRRARQARKAKVEEHVGNASTAAQAVALGYEKGLEKGYHAGGREIAELSSLDASRHSSHALTATARHSSGSGGGGGGGGGISFDQGQATPQRGHYNGGTSQEDHLMLSGISALSLQSAPMRSPSLFSPLSVAPTAPESSTSGNLTLEAGPESPRSTGTTRHRAAPSSYSRELSPRSRTVRARRRARAGGDISPLAGGDSRILARLESERSGVFASHSLPATELADDFARDMPSATLDRYRRPASMPSASSQELDGANPESPRSHVAGRESSKAAKQKLRAQALAQQRSSPSAVRRSPGRSRAATPGGSPSAAGSTGSRLSHSLSQLESSSSSAWQEASRATAA